MASRHAVGEVVGSVSMLAITIALLGGASYLALASVNGAADMVGGSARQQSRDIGVLLSVVGSQSNASGRYVWLFDYGWESAAVGSVFLDSKPLAWTTTCAADWQGSVCVLSFPPGGGGLLTIVVGGKSVEVSL